MINKKKRTCKIVDIGILVDHSVKLKESEKILWNKMMIRDNSHNSIAKFDQNTEECPPDLRKLAVT